MTKEIQEELGGALIVFAMLYLLPEILAHVLCVHSVSKCTMNPVQQCAIEIECELIWPTHS